MAMNYAIGSTDVGEKITLTRIDPITGKLQGWGLSINIEDWKEAK